ncbi:GNAT family N-acetyltransferase [Oceanobacillus massiliensis]|uniref:GNAT family N-acetyltransferase n=1 Tax=Oceanobacillus massiliensis TaxID=1465765 RepID=UPI00028951F5|nr:GNAT family N-acetyltransferase [Oceanobacillus massiliensis]
MIRRLTKKDHDICFDLLRTNSAENLFIIGDIEAYGYEQDFQKLWGDFNEDGELIAVLMKYEENYIPYATDSFHAEGFAEIISSDNHFKMMSGIKEITDKIEPYIKLPLKRKRQFYYAKCIEVKSNPNGRELSKVQKAVPEDAEAIVELLNGIPEFSDTTITTERKRRGLQNGTSRTFFIMEDGKMVSTASTTAENSLSAMIVGVATMKGYKGKGYATKCVLRVCTELLAEGKELCLFYDNPAAGAIYKRIGFKDIGLWMMNTYR